MISADSSFWKGEFFVVQTTAIESIGGDYQGSFVGCCVTDRLSLKCTEKVMSISTASNRSASWCVHGTSLSEGLARGSGAAFRP